MTREMMMTNAPLRADSRLSTDETSSVTLARLIRGMTMEGLVPPTIAPSNRLCSKPQSSR
jgi:hypothetical protein